jgi:hypothetical protein
MTEVPASEPPQGTPGRRALGAMESAVRRVRESAGEPPVLPSTSAPRPTEDPGQAAPPPPDRPKASPGPVEAPFAGETPRRTSEAGSPWWDRRGERWLAGAVIAVAVLVVAAGIALAASLSGNSSLSPNPVTVAAPTVPHDHGQGGKSTRHGTTHPSTAPSTSGTSGTSAPPAPSTSTTSTLPAVPGAPPVIAALNPASGGPGQAIQVAGANFLSTSGHIVATFNGQVAPTSCPAQNTCMVTVPQMAGPSAQVVITTASGTSNSVMFTYT